MSGALPLENPLGTCHLPAMAGETTRDQESKPSEKEDKELTREEKLAKALRDNLRRRKAKKD
ncbi:hypothetical protein HK107_09940 [Parvularcula sp. ZS-1/3]|uniref:Uncharacterized protein n=1 Tax=Parvularcula mediterranea TaxID=2732508 RepID=A0A7Y3W5U7_9PROT|nr:hypothetical protein [Parvularcula mediterranea]